MSGTVYALLVGIDVYPPPVPWLTGCRNDVTQLTAFLEGHLGERLRLATLIDKGATRQAMIDTIRSHLGKAGAGDVALFAYSGHGSEEPAPAEYAALEPSGRIQTLVPVDVGRRDADGVLVRPLADKELAVLFGEVAASGPHVAILLDCCHSGSGTRDAETRVRQWLPDPDRGSPEYRADLNALAAARPIDEFLTGSDVAGSASNGPVTLSACHSFELAKEIVRDGGGRGVFSIALLETLAASGPTTTYRSLLAGVRARIEREVGEQSPVLDPVDVNGPADSLVFDGTIVRPDAAFHVTQTTAGFEVDAGSIHGLRSASGSEAFLLACLVPGSAEVAGLVRVTDARAARSVVEPIDWQPEDLAYEAVIASVPLPTAVVRFDPGGLPEGYDRVRKAISVAGPGETPSPYLGVEEDDQDGTHGERGDRLVMRVAAIPDGYTVEAIEDGRATTREAVRGAAFRILRADGTPMAADQPGIGESAARAVVARLEHIARWEQLKSLGGHPSPLRDAIRLDLFAALPSEVSRPADRAPLAAAAEQRLAYRRLDAGWEAPAMFLSLVNTADHDLFVGVLDLTDRYRCHASLFPTARIGAGHTVAISGGKPIPAALPADRALVRGAVARDWLKVIVSETDFDAFAFAMPALGEPFPATRSAAEPGSTLERLAGRVLVRGAAPAPPPGAPNPDWCAETYAVTIMVP